MKNLSKRLSQIILICLLLCFSWLGMQAVHECGHILAAFFTGASIEKVKLNPLEFSQTVLSVNPYPLFVAVSGALFGSILPLFIYIVFRAFNLRYLYVFKFFAGFCLLCNGLYLGAGGFINAGDAFDIIKCGIPLWALLLWGIFTVPSGFYLWHNEGRYFGFGDDVSNVDKNASLLLLCMILLLFLIELIL